MKSFSLLSTYAKILKEKLFKFLLPFLSQFNTKENENLHKKQPLLFLPEKINNLFFQIKKHISNIY